MNNNRMLLWGLVFLLAIRCLAMVVFPLTDPTEARYAEIARKMVETGNWITPQFDYGVPFWAKPPLHTWLSAIGIALFGATPFAARLGILLATVATILILWRWVERLTNRTTALVAITILSTAGLFYVAAAFVQTDMVLTLGIVACMTGFYSGIQGHRGWGWLFFLGLAIGLLAKGPVAVVLSGAPIGLWVIWYRKWSSLNRLPWLAGMALVIILVVPWYVAAEIATPGFLRYFIIGEHIQRFLQPGWTGDLYGSGREHARGTIWLFWLLAALPWTPLLPLLIWRLRKGIPADTGGLYSYLFLFAVVPLLFFTASANIIVTYALPGLPAAAVLATLLWIDTSPTGAGWLKLGVAEIVVIGLALCVASVAGLNRLLPTEATLLNSFPDDKPLAILNARSFSAEFYRQGQIKKIKTVEELRSWLTPGAGVLVPKHGDDVVVDSNGKQLKLSGEDHNFRLYIYEP